MLGKKQVKATVLKKTKSPNKAARKPDNSKIRSRPKSMAEEKKSRNLSTDDSTRGELAGAGSLDKVRDILFGAQSREYEKKIIRLEERIARESSDLRSEIKMRFDSLEAYIKGEVESLTDRWKSEQSERAESVKDLSRELKDLTKTVEKKTLQLDERVTKTQRELREQILDQSKSLSSDMRQKYEELSAALDREASELRNDKTDRSALADMFTELAMRLNNEFKLPGAEDLGNG
jgi:DNA repair exonuclease SbcCD ATPase subunit